MQPKTVPDISQCLRSNIFNKSTIVIIIVNIYNYHDNKILIIAQLIMHWD